ETVSKIKVLVDQIFDSSESVSLRGLLQKDIFGFENGFVRIVKIRGVRPLVLDDVFEYSDRILVFISLHSILPQAVQSVAVFLFSFVDGTELPVSHGIVVILNVGPGQDLVKSFVGAFL